MRTGLGIPVRLRACRPGPLRGFGPRGPPLEALVGLIVIEHVPDDLGQFLGHYCPGNTLARAMRLFVVKGFDHRIPLHRPNGRFGVDGLQVAVALLAAAVAGFSAGVRRPRHQPAVAEILFGARKPPHIIRFGQDRIGPDHANTGDFPQVLDLLVRYQSLVQPAFQIGNLLI